jgi:hypothetical protein
MELVGQVKVREEALGDLRVSFFERKHHCQLQTRWEDLIKKLNFLCSWHMQILKSTLHGCSIAVGKGFCDPTAF